MPKMLIATCAALVLIAAPALGEADYLDGAALHDAGLAKYWQLRVPLATDQQITTGYLVDEQIYLATADGVVFAIHAPSGALRWRKQITSAGYDIRKPCHAGDRVVFITPPSITQYDRYSGQPISKIDTWFPTGSPAISDGMRLFVGGIDSKMYAIPLDLDFEQWKSRASGPITSQPQLFDGYLYFASHNGNIYACMAQNKEFYWRTFIHASVTADLVVDKNGVYVAAGDNLLYLLDPAEGGRRWRARFSGPLREAPVVTEETAFQYCAPDGVAAINTGTVGVEQRIRWTIPNARKALTVVERSAYLLSNEQTILVADLDDGRTTHTVAAPGFTLPLSSPNVPAVFVASADGRIFCAKPEGSPPLLASDVVKAMSRPEPEAETGADGEAAAAGEVKGEEDALASKRAGSGLGGKSKVSKEYDGD